MSKPGEEFIGLVPPKEKRPRSSFFGPAGITSFIRDQLSISSWMCLGAVVQFVLFLIVGRLAAVPAIAVLLYRFLDAYAMAVGWKRNVYMDGVIKNKFSAQIPDGSGRYGTRPADSSVVVLLIGARGNHPMGIFAPGAKELGDYFVSMTRTLDKNPKVYDFLGATSYLNSSDRIANSEVMAVCYFRSVEGLHAFAHSEHHRKGWDWWNRNVKQFPHLAIYHEVYHAPKSNWESIYINSHPLGIASVTSKVTDEKTGKDMWASPIVDASKGFLKTSAGRMGRSNAEEHEKYGY